MIFGIFVLLVAISISLVSAFYSVTGLTAIFGGAFWSIVIMGSALEAGKITATLWLHKYWNRSGWQFKLYLIPAVVILIGITSMGTFGYLSAAHLEQSTMISATSSQVQIFDDKIKTEQDNIATNKQALAQLDAQVNQQLGRTTDSKGVSKSVQIRHSQLSERKQLQADIALAQKNIVSIQAERAPVATTNRIAESHIGPVKYIAALIYGDNPDANLLEHAVRWVIIMLVFVFDPLAIVLLLAAEQSLRWAKEDKKEPLLEVGLPAVNRPHNAPDEEFAEALGAMPEIEDLPVEEEDAGVTQFFKNGREIAQRLDAEAAAVIAETNELLENPVPDWKPQFDIDIKADQVVEPDLTPVPDFASVESRSDFGKQFPPQPEVGDTFLFTLLLPHKLYKWNGNDWIVLDKTTTDRYAYDKEYIKYLSVQLQKGEYDVEMLSQTEQEQIMQYLEENK